MQQACERLSSNPDEAFTSSKTKTLFHHHKIFSDDAHKEVIFLEIYDFEESTVIWAVGAHTVRTSEEKPPPKMIEKPSINDRDTCSEVIFAIDRLPM